MPSPDLYAILRLREDATAEEIKAQHRKLAREHHPDRVTDPAKKAAASARFVELQAAYDVLSDPQRRAAYDRTRRVGVPPGMPLDLLLDEGVRAAGQRVVQELSNIGVESIRATGHRLVTWIRGAR